MPKNKQSKKDDTSDSDSGPEDRGPAKKQKTQAKSSSGAAESSWSLGKNRFVELKEFKGKWYVSIREFYSVDGELRPGKKGIMLSMEQYQKVKDIIPLLDDAIKQNV